jgi:hypothetical protein
MAGRVLTIEELVADSDRLHVFGGGTIRMNEARDANLTFTGRQHVHRSVPEVHRARFSVQQGGGRRHRDRRSARWRSEGAVRSR